MKKTIITLLSIPALLLSNGCIEDADVTGYLTEDAKNEVASQDPDKVFAATVAGMYNDMQQYYYANLTHNYFGQKSFDYLTSLFGNDMIMFARQNMSLYHYLIDYAGQDYTPTANRWREYYRVIDNANQILASISADETSESVLKYKAIALGFRGYAYLQLSYLYAFPYYVGADGTDWGKGTQYDHSEDACVPIITETITGQQPRSTVKQVYAQIESDLKDSYNLFKQINMVKTSTPTDMDGCVAANYLARTYMLMHDWDNALTYAQAVIDNFPVLTTEDQILQGFSNITLPDIVFGCDITSDNSTTYMSWFSMMDVYGDGYAGIGVWRAGFKPFVDKIADKDIRLKWFCCQRTGVNAAGKTLLRDTEYTANVEYQSVKFIGTGRENIKAGVFDGWELGDYIYLRSEEAYLMKAECLAHKGSADAVTVLTDFMKTRQSDYAYTFTTKAALLKEINFQKRVEFWGEGQEFLDNRRLNIPVDRTDATWGAANNNHLASARFKLEQEDPKFRYQLPIAEIENNQMISAADQNPL